MRQDEVKARLNALESRVDILEGKPEKVKLIPKPKPVEIKQEPIIGTTTDPFNPESKGAPKPKDVKVVNDKTTTENVAPEPAELTSKQEVKGKEYDKTPSKFSKEYSEPLDEEPEQTFGMADSGKPQDPENKTFNEAADQLDEGIKKGLKPKENTLDIDPLDKHLNDEMLEKKYGDRTEEAKKLIAELDNEK